MQHQVLELDGDWALRYCDAGQGEAAGWPQSGVEGPESYPAEVPGDVHLDLARAGVIPEPLEGENVTELGWMEEKDWWYSTTFTPEADFMGDRMELVFHGLDTFADVWLNGVHLGKTSNAFISHTFDVTGLLRESENLLVVRVDTGLRWAKQQEIQRYCWPGDATMAERIWLRRAQFTGGWDWGPRLLTVGIWRSVELHSYRGLALRDVCLSARLLGQERALIQAQYEIQSLADCDVQAIIELSLDGEGGTSKRLETTLAPGPNLVRDLMVLEWPRLWWPNGMGEQYLYDVRCTVTVDGQVLDGTEFSYGVREVSLAQEELEGDEGQSFTFLINGEPLFCKGADWVPADSIPARITPEKYWALVEDAAEANFNMFRVWGGGIYEDDAWWDACDSLGLLVWQDFMFACSAIPDDDPEFAAQLEHEARQIVRRLRNRASLALWCGNNENQWIAGRVAPHTSHCGRPTYHEMLPRVCAELDPSRYYWPSSPWGGVDPNSERLGDRHSWDIALNPDLDVRTGFRAYTADRAKFISEYGFLAPPVEASLPKFLPEDQLRLGSPAWQLHENTFDRGVVRHAVRRYFGRDPESL
ncbi:MAG: glycoside hydrolase family 2 protein, partial [Anaerolineae bacterium]